MIVSKITHSGDDMKITGYLDGIAKGEDMKAARFLGNALYLVTFMQTDPLFDNNDGVCIIGWKCALS